MYTNFYNLKEKPFELTPSPRFLYLGETHKEALSLLTYGVMERKGFVLLTGEVGTGKTTLVQTLLKNLDSSIKCVCLSNPTLSVKDFLFYVTTGLGLKTQFISKSHLLVQFEDFLQSFFQHQKNVLLIVDEAQRLSFRLLEEIRLLSNIESADRKLINIFLVGQPELNEKLSQPICRPLLQRISLRYHIKPLDLEGTQEYIETRLNVAGAENGYKIFPNHVIKAVHQYSEGYPRMINILADNVLLLGYSKGEKRITPAMVKECYHDICIDNILSRKRQQSQQASSSPLRSYWKWTLALFFVIIFTATFTSRGGQNFFWHLAGSIPIISQAPLKELSKEQPLLLKRKIDAVSTNPREKRSASAFQTEKKQAGTIIPLKKPNEIESSLRVEDRESWRSVIVKKGDTLSKLAAAVYGRADEDILKLVRKNNPEIKDINRIEIGQKIIFPPLATPSRQERESRSQNENTFK